MIRFVSILCITFAISLCAACATQTPTTAPTLASVTPTVSSPAPSPQAKIDPRKSVPCDALSVEEAAAIMGTPVRLTAKGNVRELDKADFIACLYNTPRPPITGFSFTVYGRQNAANAAQFYEESKKEDIERQTYTPVEGFGEEAYWDGALLLIRRGELVYGVSGAKTLGKPDFDLTKMIAEKVLGRFL